MEIKIKRRSLEKYYADLLAENAGLTPIIKQLVMLDRFPALRALVVNRGILYKLIIYAKSRTATKPTVKVNTHEIITAINKLVFGQYAYNKITSQKNKEEFEGLISIIQNTVFSFLFDNLKLPPKMRQELRNEFEKVFKAVNAVYGPLDHENSFIKETNSFLELFSLAFPEKKGAEPLIDQEELVVDVTSDSFKKDVEDYGNEQIAEDRSTKLLDEPPLLTRKEVAAIFGISLPTLAVWEKNGSIPKAFRTGSRVYFRNSDIVKHIESLESKLPR